MWWLINDTWPRLSNGLSRHGSRRQFQVIGQKHQHAIVLLIVELDPPEEGFLAGPRQLTEEHGDKLAPAAEPASMTLRVVLAHG
ncbi:MAG: hypothetical protein ABSG16_24190 [Candidatus Acidiferrum sp.]|jgi:hypothetical protein